uniref:Creatininase n=1 Tax=uncultured marine thaumarchaeote KM3_45_E05 TaxID=1456156 RepID=A0A075H5J0_9ARCH|nr:creatininase [uncultured marine thaumarchaeote KM3_45_E05]
MNIDDLYDPEFRKLIKSKKPTVIIPVGSIEQHGAHLPISTDSDIVTEIASRLAKKCGFIVFPTISYGVSWEHEPLFNTSLKAISLKKILDDIITSLRKNHIKRIIILNGHHGNLGVMGQYVVYVDKLYMKKFGITVSKFSYWLFMKHQFDHAGFVETSLMLAISNKVKMKKAKKGFVTNGVSDREKRKIGKLATKPGGFPKVTKNGVWGDPTGATKKDGQKFLAEIIRNLAKECQS